MKARTDISAPHSPARVIKSRSLGDVDMTGSEERLVTVKLRKGFVITSGPFEEVDGKGDVIVQFRCREDKPAVVSAQEARDALDALTPFGDEKALETLRRFVESQDAVEAHEL